MYLSGILSQVWGHSKFFPSYQFTDYLLTVTFLLDWHQAMPRRATMFPINCLPVKRESLCIGNDNPNQRILRYNEKSISSKAYQR